MSRTISRVSVCLYDCEIIGGRPTDRACARARPAAYDNRRARRPRGPSPAGRAADAAAAGRRWRSVRPTPAAVRALLTTVLLYGCSSAIWDRQRGREGGILADSGGTPRRPARHFLLVIDAQPVPTLTSRCPGGVGSKTRLWSAATDGLLGHWGCGWVRSTRNRIARRLGPVAPADARCEAAWARSKIAAQPVQPNSTKLGRNMYKETRSGENGWTGRAGRARRPRLGVSRHPTCGGEIVDEKWK